MTRKLNAFALGALLLLGAAGLSAQNVFVLPPAFGLASNITAFTANPFAQAGTFSANFPATQVFTADGLKFYIVAANGTNTVMAVDSTFTNVRLIASLGSPATASALSPDGRRLIVATATLQIFDTATDAQLAAGINVGGTTIDLAANLESTRAFALANTGSGTQLTAIDLASSTSVGSIPIPGFATGISTGPNDLLYVTTLNAVLEIDPRSMSIRQQISVVGRPGKMVFTPDGKLGIMPNQTPITGMALISLDLNSRVVGAGVATASLPANTVLDKILPVTTNRILALSTASQTAFDITLNPIAVSAFAFSAVGSITAAATTSDISTPLHAVTQYLFFLAGGNLYRVDLSAAQLSGQLPVSTGGSISVATAPVTATPATMLTFGDNQSVTFGGTTLPLVVRLLDAQGRPLARTQVTFSTAAPGVTLSATTANTSNDGFAAISATAPSVLGPFNVLASAAGGLNASFTVNVGVVGGGVTGGLTVTGGQGQLLLEQAVSAPLSVVLKDTNGNPVVGGNVTFTLTQGSGTLLGGISSTTNVTVVQTDSTGTASINFLSTLLFSSFPGFESELITASTDAGASVTFFITTAKAVANPTSGVGGPTVLVLKPNAGDSLAGQAGQTLKGAIQVQVFSISGQAIPNVSLFIQNPQDPTVAPSAMCAGTVALTGSNGIASCDLVLGGQLGLVQILGNVGNFATLFPISIRITAGAPGAVTIVQGNNQSGKPGDRLPLSLVVQVTDAFGNVLPGVSVNFKVVTPGSLTLVNVIGVTDATGRAGASVILGNTAGTFQVTATVGNITKTFNETVAIPAGGLQLVSGNGQSTVINTAFPSPLVVRAVDANGNGFAGAQVQFAVTGGVASFVGASTPTTDVQGNASVNVMAGANQGAITITATFSGFTVTFTLSARLPGPANITFFNGASFAQNVVSPGAIVTIHGNGMLTGVQGLFTAFNILGPLPTSFPLPANVGTGSILFNNVAAPVFYVSNISGVETVTVQVPFETPTGIVTVTINGVGGGTAQFNVQVAPLGPGVFETLDGNAKIAVVQRPDGSYVSSRNPAHRNERLRIYVTGLGQVSPSTATGSAGVPNQAVVASLIVGLNNAGVPLISAEYAPGFVGVYVITIQVPSDAALGPAQPFGLIAMDSLGNQYIAQSTVLPIM